ncbi:PE-PPE domain-containing protein [Mycolicibacterium sp. YH-1]|uniref:PE-PPE domain-containing protein n=1 Tax=Mycolicibacterium sp. YH-1 TaxID=2908837 RepID=UPI001F4C2752|nr:PE-PPE domain-containing protein [Mycolicibacterium sp. YH-1]UNB51465.1 PE-PPE domain-containing protein [Mycolicibacterium sp. YH-1]
MRKSARVIGLVFVSIIGTIGLAIGAVFGAAFAAGAIALLVPGTGTPNANIVADYRENIRDRFLQTTSCTNEVNCPTDPDLKGINYPASFWPLSIFPSWCRSGPDGCDKWDESVGKGALALTAALNAALASPEDEIVVFGYSQGGAVLSKVLKEYGLTEEEKARLRVVTIGGIQNPDGGLWQRLAFLGYIPGLDVTFGPPMPVDPNIKTTTYGFEYDPVVYAPRYWGNPFAMLNALAAFDNVHGYYLSPNGNGPDSTMPYGYTPATLAPHLVCNVGVNCRLDEYGNEYIMIPATSLPIMNLVMSLTPAALKPFVKPIIDLISPVYKVLADLGYDWSGDPGKSTSLSILPFNPFQDWSIVAGKLVGAVIQGIEDAIRGGPSIVGPATVPDPTSTLAAAKKFVDVAQLASVTELKPADVATGVQAPVTELVEPVEPVEPVAPVEEVPAPVEEVEPVETVAEVQEPSAPVAAAPDTTKPETEESTTKTGETETGVTKKDEPRKDETEKVDAKPAKKADEKKADEKNDESKKAEPKKIDAKPAKKASESDNKDTGADDKKAAA